MKVNSNVAILGCVILDGENNIWYSGGSFNNGFPVHYTENINDLMETEHVTFCSAFIKKSIFDEIGLIDESYFMKYEDVDFCKRVNLIGKYRVCVLPYPLVRHVGVHASMSDYRNEYYHYKSLLKFQKKYYRKSFVKNIFMDIPFVLLVDVLRIIKAIIYQDTNKARRLMTSLNGIIRGTIKELVSIK
jgi:hypothetical protein